MDGGEIRENIRLGQMEFRSPAHVMGWLRENGVAILALSYDTRYTDRPEAWIRLPRDTRMREPRSTLSGCVYRRRATRCLRALRSFDEQGGNLTESSCSDGDDRIGGASGQDGKPLRWSSVLELGYCVPCEGKGFSRPTILHVAPDGGVRTCLYAPGGGWMGNVNRESLPISSTAFPKTLSRRRSPVEKSRVLCGNGHQAVCPRLPLCRSPLCGVGGSCQGD